MIVVAIQARGSVSPLLTKFGNRSRADLLVNFLLQFRGRVCLRGSVVNAHDEFPSELKISKKCRYTFKQGGKAGDIFGSASVKPCLNVPHLHYTHGLVQCQSA
jgi:hypothetical protein